MIKALLVSSLAILVIVIFIVAMFMVPRMKRYSKIFNINHYYEIYHKISEIKNAAIGNIKSDVNYVPLKKDDPRVLITDAGLVIVYTITPSDNNNEHHLSVSCYGQYTPHAVGEHFTLYVADIMSWKIQNAIFFFTKMPVYHATIQLQEEEHLAWEKRPIIIPEFERKDDLRKRIQELRGRVRFQFVVLPEKDGQHGL